MAPLHVAPLHVDITILKEKGVVSASYILESQVLNSQACMGQEFQPSASKLAHLMEMADKGSI